MQSLQKRQQEEQKSREILASDVIKTVDERVNHCKILQYSEHQQIFATMYTTIHKAAADNSVAGLKHFLKLPQSPQIHIDDFDKNGNCPIHIAAEKGACDAIQFIVDSGCSPDFRNTYGSTALMLACKENRLEAISLLFKLGAKVEAANRAGTIVFILYMAITIYYTLK